MKNRAWWMRAAVSAGVLLAAPMAAMAQFVPEVMDPIVLPVTLASITEELLTIGAAVLVAVALIVIPIHLARKVIRRGASAI